MGNPAIDTDFQIATHAAGIGGLATLQSLGIPNPHPIYKPGVQSIKLGDHSARVIGSPNLEWHWGFLTAAQRDTLRTYCSGGSANVYIKSVTTEKVSGVSSAARVFDCQMWWPAPNAAEDPQAGRRLDFILTFWQLVDVTP